MEDGEHYNSIGLMQEEHRIRESAHTHPTYELMHTGIHEWIGLNRAEGVFDRELKLVPEPSALALVPERGVFEVLSC
ncbi:MAG: hypothetical protein ACK53C_14575, partial [Pseudomonadota bacterium]